VPENPRGIVVFAHGSGSSRHSPRNRYVADVLNEAGLGTLLFDLLTPEEELDRANVFDIGLLAGRLVEVTRWLRAQPRAARAAVGYFGASTGAAAALRAAAEPGTGIAAVVSRGGRPDLAPLLAAVTAPTLLIVAGMTTWCWTSTAGPRRSYAARTTWLSCPAHPRGRRPAGPGLVHQPPRARPRPVNGVDDCRHRINPEPPRGCVGQAGLTEVVLAVAIGPAASPLPVVARWPACWP
jgi:hypothetical protein